MRAGGMVNEAWDLGGTHVLRIVMEGLDPECDAEAEREAAIVPLMVEAGLTTPKLVAFESDPSVAPRPYSIYEMAPGDLLGYSDIPMARFEPAYRQVGREMAVLHRMSLPDEVQSKLLWDVPTHPLEHLEKTLAAGMVTREDAAEIARWIPALEERGGDAPDPVPIHNDVHAWNLMADPDSGELTALLDWGDASIGDPARDFAMMPLPAVPAMLEGYAEAGGTVDKAFVARSLHVSMETALWELRSLDGDAFDRRWWRMPSGGWAEMKCQLEERFPEHAP